MATVVPPGGFAGYAQMTQASQKALSSGLRPVKSRQSSKAGKALRARNNRIIKNAKSGRSTKYNTKAWMAKIRKLRGKGKGKRKKR